MSPRDPDDTIDLTIEPPPSSGTPLPSDDEFDLDDERFDDED